MRASVNQKEIVDEDMGIPNLQDEVVGVLSKKEKIYKILEPAFERDLSSKAFDIFLIIVIFLNVLAVILESVKSIGVAYSGLFNMLSLFSIAFFSIEYIEKWSCFVGQFFGEVKLQID